VSNGDRISIEYPLTLMVGNGSVGENDEFEYVAPDPVTPIQEEGDVDEFEEIGEIEN
jgi:hypothetical protein